MPCLTFWIDTSSASPTGELPGNHFQDPEEAERLGWGDCFPKGRIPGQRKLIYVWVYDGSCRDGMTLFYKLLDPVSEDIYMLHSFVGCKARG